MWGECARGGGACIGYGVSVRSAGQCARCGISIHKVWVKVHRMSLLRVGVTAQGAGQLCAAWVSVHSMREYGGVCATCGECAPRG